MSLRIVSTAAGLLLAFTMLAAIMSSHREQYTSSPASATELSASTIQPPCSSDHAFSCSHGTCVAGKLECKCQSGYEGQSCDIGPVKDTFSKIGHEMQTLALAAVQLSRVVYKNDLASAEASCPGITTKIEDLKIERFSGTGHNFGSSGIVRDGPLKGMPFLAFRGTDSYETWKQDATFYTYEKTIGGRKMSVHRGFWDAIETNENMIHSILTAHVDAALAKGQNQILVTGHSLGGALATVYALILKQRRPSIKIHLITFGGPRVGDARLARAVEADTANAFRFVDAQSSFYTVWYDLIATIPNYSSMLDSKVAYQHAGIQITMGVDDGTPQVAGAMEGQSLWKNLHQMKKSYIPRMKFLTEKANVHDGIVYCS